MWQEREQGSQTDRASGMRLTERTRKLIQRRRQRGGQGTAGNSGPPTKIHN